MQRIAVGARCERLWGEAVRASDDAALSAATKNVRRQFAKAKLAPVHKRKSWIAATRLYNYVFGDYLGDVRAALQEDQGIDLVDDNREPARWLFVKGRRPKIGKQIKAQVAAEFGITPRMAESCWKEYRADVRAILSEDE